MIEYTPTNPGTMWSTQCQLKTNKDETVKIKFKNKKFCKKVDMHSQNLQGLL